MKNWIKYYLDKTGSQKSLENVMQHLKSSGEAFEDLAIRSFKSNLGLNATHAKKEYQKLRRKYFFSKYKKICFLLLLIIGLVAIFYFVKFITKPQSHKEILTEYLQGHFDKEHKIVNKHHANNIAKYWDMIEPNKESITTRNNNIWNSTGDSMLLIDTIVGVDSPIYFIYYKAFKDPSQITIKKQRCLRIKFMGKKIIEVVPCEK